MNFLKSLLSGDESLVDSVIVAGVFALVVFAGATVYAIVRDPATWNPVSYGTGATAIIAAIGGAKRVRDGQKG